MVSDEAIRRRVMGNRDAIPGKVPGDGRRLVELDPAEALELLAGVSYGRVVFTQHALPAIRPLNHLVDAGRIIIQTRLTAKVTSAIEVLKPTVVAYEADQLDPVERLGWSVVVTGFAHPITDDAEAARLQAALIPWVDMTMDTVLAIHPEIITGYRLTPTA